MTAPTPSLSPCPFCGGEAAVGGSPEGAFVNCVECLASTNILAPWNGLPEDAIAEWNRRPTGETPIPVAPTDYDAAARDVLAERERQKSVEGWTTKHDDDHAPGEMALAASCYAVHAAIPESKNVTRLWPWSAKWWKPKDARRDLVRAGALILAEIERMDRAGRVVDNEGAQA